MGLGLCPMAEDHLALNLQDLSDMDDWISHPTVLVPIHPPVMPSNFLIWHVHHDVSIPYFSHWTLLLVHYIFMLFMCSFLIIFYALVLIVFLILSLILINYRLQSENTLKYLGKSVTAIGIQLWNLPSRLCKDAWGVHWEHLWMHRWVSMTHLCIN